jgi:hypothetical protein
MYIFKKIFDLYLQSSIHVALSVFALVRITQQMFMIYSDGAVAGFVFFGTIVGYNFVKYDALARTHKLQMGVKLKSFVFISFISFLAVGYYFFQLERIAQYFSVAFLVLTLLYTLPFFPNRKNARNWAGLKIYIVTLCWVGVTVVLPLLNAGVSVNSDFYLKCIQRFLLVFILVLIFEIIDLRNDDPHLKTVPQQIGVNKTKKLGLLLLIPFCFLEFFIINSNPTQLLVNLILVIIIALFLLFSNENRSKYYSSFWVESIPVLWWLMILCSK